MYKILLKKKLGKNYQKVERMGWTILVKMESGYVVMEPFFATRKEARDFKKLKHYTGSKVVRMRHIETINWK